MFLAFGLILSTYSASAGLPQPICVFYGEALDGFGWPYTTNATVVLRHNSQEIAKHEIHGSLVPGANFALPVHLDDGRTTNAYSARALRSGDLVSIVVRDGFGEHPIMEQQAIPAVGQPGELISVNVTAGADSDGDGLPDPWEQELIYWSFGALHSLLDVNPGDDFDGDGQSNGDEYRAGTYAFLDYDLFFAEHSGRTANGRFWISFLSVPGKVYGARYKTSLRNSIWVAAPIATSLDGPFQISPVVGDGNWLTLYLPGENKSRFYRPTVEGASTYHVSATATVGELLAADRAGNDPYPVTHFQIGDNGGDNFEPWVKLESDTLIGTHYLGNTIGDSLYSWGLSGTYAVGRSLPGTAHHGLWQVRMVHNPDNGGFSGFNLKTTSLAGFDANEILRVGLAADQIGFNGEGIYLSFDQGITYTFWDCGWNDGRGDRIIYQILWDEDGSYTLTVVNVSENKLSRFTGTLPTSAVTTMGMAVLGKSLNETVQFDSLTFQSVPILNIQRAGDNVVLSWLTGFNGYTLQSTSDLAQPGGWTPVNGSVVSLAGISSVTLPISGSHQFFRLVK